MNNTMKKKKEKKKVGQKNQFFPLWQRMKRMENTLSGGRAELLSLEISEPISFFALLSFFCLLNDGLNRFHPLFAYTSFAMSDIRGLHCLEENLFVNFNGNFQMR